MNNNCGSICGFTLVLFALVAVLMCLKYYYYKTRQGVKETFQVPVGSEMSYNTDEEEKSLEEILSNPHRKKKYFNPCEPERFKKNMYEFYQSAEDYRKVEKDMNQARHTYEDKYVELQQHKRKLDGFREKINKCLGAYN